MTTPFTITAPPNTDIWRKPTRSAFDAPTVLQAPIPLSTLHRAALSFSGNWLHQYDQGGLFLLLTSTTNPSATSKWLKTGVEFFEGKALMSTVACESYIDMGFYPLPEGDVRVEVERKGVALWVFLVGEGGRVPVREVGWFFAGEEDMEVRVGAWAARPGKVDGDEKAIEAELEVRFWGLEVEKR